MKIINYKSDLDFVPNFKKDLKLYLIFTKRDAFCEDCILNKEFGDLYKRRHDPKFTFFKKKNRCNICKQYKFIVKRVDFIFN